MEFLDERYAAGSSNAWLSGQRGDGTIDESDVDLEPFRRSNVIQTSGLHGFFVRNECFR